MSTHDGTASVKLVLTVFAFVALGIAVFVFLVTNYGRRDASPRPERVQVVSHNDDKEVAQLVQQVQELQGRLNSLKSQMTQLDAGAAHAVPTRDVKPAEPLSVEEQRAQDRERLKTYMAVVEQSFANEKVDAAWATRTASKVATTFDGDDVLKGVAHTVECRSQTCRVQIEDDGSNQLARRMPFIAIGLADVLPTISAQHIDTATGRGATVLYMSSQPSTPPTAAK